MKKVESYQCEICEHIYENEDEARACEAIPVSKARGVKIGDRVLITGGGSTGKQCLINDIQVCGPNWGKAFQHTVVLIGKIIGGPFSRVLTFEQYEPIKKTKRAS